MAIPKTDEEAREWLIVNDPEAADFWRNEKPAVEGDLIRSYWDNVLDFGPEENYTAQELEVYHNKLAERADKLIDQLVGQQSLNTFKVLVKKVEYEYYYIQATSAPEAITNVQAGLDSGYYYLGCGLLRVEEAAENDLGTAIEAEECS